MANQAAGQGNGIYLINRKALTKVFRAEILSAIEAAGLMLPG